MRAAKRVDDDIGPLYDDLAPWARRDLDQAYETRERVRCSREDFTDGFIAALIALRSKSAFRSGELPS